MMIFSLVAMTGLEKCCITSAYLQWLCHSGERPVARGPLVFFIILGLEETSMTYFEVSPDGNVIVFMGKYGRMHLISSKVTFYFMLKTSSLHTDLDCQYRICRLFLYFYSAVHGEFHTYLKHLPSQHST